MTLATPLKSLWDSNLPPRNRVELACRVLDVAESRLFACWCLWQIRDLLVDKRSEEAVDTAERYALGQVYDRELSLAHTQAKAVSQKARPVYVSWAFPDRKRLKEVSARPLAVHVTAPAPFTPLLALGVANGSIVADVPDRSSWLLERHPGWRVQAEHLQETYHVVEETLKRRERKP